MSFLPLLTASFLSAQIAEHDNNEKYLLQTGLSTDVFEKAAPLLRYPRNRLWLDKGVHFL